MDISQDGIDFIKSWEKNSLVAYIPALGDRPTISYGITFYEHGQPVKMGDTITAERSEELFTNIINVEQIAMTAMLKQIPIQQQLDSLMSFFHWSGAGNFEKSYLLRAFNNNPNDYNEINTGFSRPWCRPLPGLVIRRIAEYTLYTTGVYNNHN